MHHDPDAPVQGDRLASLERSFIAEFLERHGHSMQSLRGLPEAEVSALLTEASTYASSKLAEVESRAHYVHEIHDASRHSES